MSRCTLVDRQNCVRYIIMIESFFFAIIIGKMDVRARICMQVVVVLSDIFLVALWGRGKMNAIVMYLLAFVDVDEDNVSG